MYRKLEISAEQFFVAWGKPKKQIVRVLEAAYQGCNTTLDISEVTGISVAKVSNYVSELIEDGLLKRTGRTQEDMLGRKHRFLCFEPTEQSHA